MQKRPLRILVAEDVEVNRMLLSVMLERLGHAVTLVEDGRAAVAAVVRQPFDVVLMDVQMPVMDGIAATRRIRALPGGECDVPIVALTGNVIPEDQRSYLAAGMTACIDKPISWPKLEATLALVTAPGSPRKLGVPGESV